MAITSILQLKQWFKRGLKPTELQFSDWIDSFWHKNEVIPSAKVDLSNYVTEDEITDFISINANYEDDGDTKVPEANEIPLFIDDSGKSLKSSGYRLADFQLSLGYTPEQAGIAQNLINLLKDSVSSDGDTLKKLYQLIVLKINRSETLTATEIQLLITNLVDSSPETLNTLAELAEALGNDPNFATTIMTMLGGKVNTDQTISQTIGSAANRLQKLWSVDANFSNLPTILGEPITTILQPLDTAINTGNILNQSVYASLYNLIKNVAEYNINLLYMAGFYSGYAILSAPTQSDFGFVNIPIWAGNDSDHRYNLQIGSYVNGSPVFRVTNVNGAGDWHTLFHDGNLSENIIPFKNGTSLADSPIRVIDGIATISVLNQTKARFIIENKSAGGHKYSFVAGITDVDQAGFSIYDHTVGKSIFSQKFISDHITPVLSTDAWNVANDNAAFRVPEQSVPASDTTYYPIVSARNYVTALGYQNVPSFGFMRPTGSLNGDVVVRNSGDALDPVYWKFKPNGDFQIPGKFIGSSAGLTDIHNQPIRTIAPTAYALDLATGEDFTKTLAANSAFTITNPIIKKPFRLVITGGTLAANLFTGYTSNYLAGDLQSDYNPDITNWLYCEIRSAGNIYVFWGA